MKKKIATLLATGVLGVAITGGIVLASNQGVLFSRLLATNHSATNSFTITAANIAAAIGEGTEGNFTAGGLEFHVDGASVTDGVAKIEGGTLYNVTFAGTTTTADNWVGTGFKSISIANYDSKSGASLQLRNASDTTVNTIGMGAVTANQQVEDFSSTSDVMRVFLAFGAAGGTSFTSITYTYGCAEAVPEVHISAPATTVYTGNTLTLTATPKYATSPTYEWSTTSSDITLDPDGNTCVVTGVSAAASAVVRCTMTVSGVDYTDDFDLEVVASSSITYHDLAFSTSSNVQGAGANIIFDNSDTGLATGTGDLSKIEVELTFDGGTNYSGYETTMNNAGLSMVNLRDPSGDYVTLYGTMPNGFPDSGDFTHTFRMKITVGTDIYEGVLVFVGNAYSSQSGAWDA